MKASCVKLIAVQIALCAVCLADSSGFDSELAVRFGELRSFQVRIYACAGEAKHNSDELSIGSIEERYNLLRQRHAEYLVRLSVAIASREQDRELIKIALQATRSAITFLEATKSIAGFRRLADADVLPPYVEFSLAALDATKKDSSIRRQLAHLVRNQAFPEWDSIR